MITFDHIMHEIDLLLGGEVEDTKKGLYYSACILQEERHRLQRILIEECYNRNEKIKEAYNSL